jgi:hypothetical protein
VTGRLRAGDIFAVPLPDGTALCGQILLDVRGPAVRSDTPLAFYTGTVLVRVFDGPDADSGVLLPPLFVWPDGLVATGHRPAPEEVDFPQGVGMRGPRAEFTWGEVALPIELTPGQVRGIGERYLDTALRYGYDVRRFSGPERVLVLCPYCHAPFDPAEPVCPTCHRDTRNDGPLELTSRQLAEAPRVRCQFCAGPVLSTAVTCPGCRSRQARS